MNGVLTEAQKAEVVARYMAGETMTCLAGQYSVTRPAIRGILLRRKVPLRRLAKLAEQQKAEVVARYVAGETSTALAAEFEISGPSLCGILRRRSVVIRNHDSYTLWEEAFDELTAEAAYWIGFLFADGTVHYRKEGQAPTIAVGLAGCDEGHLVKLRAFLRSNHKISQMQVRVRPTTMYRSVCSFSVRSDRLARRLMELGRYQGPVVPELVGSRHFWRGVVDGDGSIGCYSGRWQFRLCGQARLLMPFTQFLVAQNMSRLSVRPHKSITALGTTGRPAERIIDLLYRGAGQAVLDRKAATAARVIDRLDNLVGE